MRLDKNQAIKLRLQGRSYNEITNLLGVPKSTLAGWLGNVVLSDKAITRINTRVREGSARGLIKKNQLQTHLAQQRVKLIHETAKKQIGVLKQRELFLLGVGLYWAEGYKRPIVRNGKPRTFHRVSLTNSDPHLIKIFLRFLREICKVSEEKIKASVRIYQHHNEHQLLEFWSKITAIPIQQFGKFYYGVSKSSQGKRPYNILTYGTLQISVGSTALYHKIMGWIEGFQ